MRTASLALLIALACSGCGGAPTGDVAQGENIRLKSEVAEKGARIEILEQSVGKLSAENVRLKEQHAAVMGASSPLNIPISGAGQATAGARRRVVAGRAGDDR